jgi:hypothetical protein
MKSVQVLPEENWPPRTLARPMEQPVISGTPDAPGDYKYGVRMLDADDRVLDDDDPYITVTSDL